MVEISRIPKLFHVTGLFLYPVKTCDVFEGIERDCWHEMGKIIRLRNAQTKPSFTELFNFKDKLIILVEIMNLWERYCQSRRLKCHYSPGLIVGF